MVAKVLVIDDAVHIRRLIIRMLEHDNYTAVQAGNGREGLQVLKQEMPDVVTCDISMPVMDGYQFLMAAKNNPETEHIPIVIVTALGQEGEINKATELGADACLTKPFSSSHLREVLDTVLNR